MDYQVEVVFPDQKVIQVKLVYPAVQVYKMLNR